MKTVNFYIDGFNLYHAAFKRHPVFVKNQKTIVGWPEFRWIDLKKLMEQFIVPEKEQIGKIYYFSAIADWIDSKAEKHKLYIKVLQDIGIEVVLGKFKAKEKRCLAKCKEIFISHEEKESDVNVAIYLLSDVLQNKCDTACLVSGDSDMIPSLRRTKKLVPDKKLGLILPPYQHGAELKTTVDFYKKINSKNLKKALLPPTITLSDGETISAPLNWLPKL